MRYLHQHLLVFSAGAWLFLVSGSALGAAPAAAEALFRSAQEAAEASDWETACDRFEESNRLDPAPGTVLNLARCHEKLGHWATSWRYYQEATDKLPEGDRRFDYASSKVLELEPRVPKVIFEQPSPKTAEFELVVNGTPYSSAMLGVKMPFDPGTIEILVRAEGHLDRTTSVDLIEGEVKTHMIEIGPSLLKKERQGPASTRGSQALPISLLAIGGVGGITAIAGGIWAAVELPTATDPDHCLDGACDEVGAEASRRGRTAVVLLGVGAGVFAVGVGLGSLLLLDQKETRVRVEPRPGGAVVSFSTHSFDL